MRVLTLLLALCIAPFGCKADGLDQVAKFIDSKYDATMILPFSGKSKLGAKQIGATYTNLRYYDLGDRTAFRWKASTPYCASAPDDFSPENEISTKDFLWKVSANLSVKASLKDVFELLSVEANYLDTLKLNLTDVRSTVPPGDAIVTKVLKSNWADTEFCRPLVFCGKKPTFIITGITEAKVELEFYFKAGVKLSVVNLTIAKVATTLGLEAEVATQTGEGPDKPWKLTSEGQHVVIGVNLTPWRELMSKATYSCN